MARPRKAPKRQPKRILNCIPSPERDEDWRIDTAEDAGLVAAAPRVPARKDLRALVVADQRPGLDRLVRRLGDRGRRAALALRQDEPDRAERADLAALPVDGGQGDGRVQLAADDVRRGRGDEPQGRARRRAQVRRRQGHGAPVRVRAGVPRQRAHVLRDRGAAQDQHVLQPRPRDRELARLARDEGADPDPAQRRLDLGQGDRDQGRARRLQAEDGARRPRGRARRLHARLVHRPEQLGHRLGRPRLRVRVARLRAGGVHRGLRGGA